MYLWPVRDDGENRHNIVNNYPSVSKKVPVGGPL